MRKLKVLVIGETGAGKTTFASMVRDILEKEGHEVKCLEADRIPMPKLDLSKVDPFSIEIDSDLLPEEVEED